jgi:hypothetical protein
MCLQAAQDSRGQDLAEERRQLEEIVEVHPEMLWQVEEELVHLWVQAGDMTIL